MFYNFYLSLPVYFSFSLPIKQVFSFSNSPVHVQYLLIYKYKLEVILRILFKTLFWHLRIGHSSPEKQQSIMEANYSSDENEKLSSQARNTEHARIL